MKSPIVAPSVLSANFAHLAADFAMLNESAAEYIHVDVMDGVFVPNISFGLPVIQAMRKLSAKTFDVHLMIVEPDKYIDAFRNAGADILTVHLEASTHLHRTLQKIHASEMKAGVAINPHTSVQLLEDTINDIDLVCVMSVNPGFGGQKFIENTYDKVARLKDLILRKNAATLIEIDGGVTLDNAARLVQSGADVLVAGNTVFNSPDPAATILQLKNIA
ncbi:MAG: ribulose-phosphate 3-epimerase [Chitinophagales bacterium]|jgi:ribulose-phosphate 3-epimerase|nr:ribulose-phosphate 3-epimerase [Chitinophagales bacterium]HQO32045.1 ribulose-phosphate 3-epimerase [Chitinophagales bacterium]HQO88694.1 ribulose-phosphate 3-epimerase [Chitinophagales bacterium]